MNLFGIRMRLIPNRQTKYIVSKMVRVRGVCDRFLTSLFGRNANQNNKEIGVEGNDKY